MTNGQQTSVAGLLHSVAGMLAQDQGQLNQISSGSGNGTHGTRVAQAFQVAAQAAQQSGSNDAGKQFAAAAQAMRQQGQGKSIGYYANGLEQAAKEFSGKTGLTANDIGPLLQALAGGVQQGNPAQPGQGTMLDAIVPAAQAFTSAKQGGQDNGQAAMQALSSAVNGAYGSMQADGGNGYGAAQGYVDPGAASATSVLGGVIKALAPAVASMVLQQLAASQAQGSQQSGGTAGGLGGLIGGLLGAAGAIPSSQGSVNAPAQGADPLGGLGGLLGGLLGGETPQGQPTQPTLQPQPGDTVG